MLEVVFTESAGGGLKLAQTIRKDCQMDGPNAVVFQSDDGKTPSQEEIDRYLASMQAEWARAKPLGGKPEDVFCFALGLSVGDISGDVLGPERQAYLQSMICIDDPAFDHVEQEIFDNCRRTLPVFLERARAGEPARIWYSDTPDEICGLYWLMTLLDDTMDIRIVKMPEYEEREDGTIVSHDGWGEIIPGDWHQYVPLEKTVTPNVRRMFANYWTYLLVPQNTLLRAVLNGQLTSAEADLYDGFIHRELDRRGSEFREANLIGDVLGRYQLGISDWWIHSRIQSMVDDGLLEVVEPCGKGNPVYHRTLRKRN